MRFDYQPPITTRRATPYYRRLAFLYLTIIVVTCISYAFVTNNSSNQSPADLNRPRILAKPTTSPTLALNGNNSSLETSPLIQAAAQLPLPTEIWRSVTINTGDSLSKVFQTVGIDDKALQMIVNDRALKTHVTKLQPGQKLDFRFDSENNFKELKLKISLLKTLHIENADNLIKHYFEEHTTNKRLNFTTAQINDTLYNAAQAVGLPDSIIMQMADILGWDIDFSLDIRANDTFKILYEEEYLEDEIINFGKILAVEFVNKGKSYKAVRYTDSKGKDGYYSPEGYSLQKAFIRNPVNYTRISSHFSVSRRHPVLHKIRSHKGVDYAAPQGTPIKAAGDGSIDFIGNKGGYGKVIEIKHGQKYSTLYAHLSRFNSKLKKGSSVKQGQIIGYVGQTGLATGPHLHYEFRINGVHHNPITVALPRSLPIANTEKNDFSVHANNVLDLLDSHSKLAHNG